MALSWINGKMPYFRSPWLHATKWLQDKFDFSKGNSSYTESSDGNFCQTFFDGCCGLPEDPAVCAKIILDTPTFSAQKDLFGCNDHDRALHVIDGPCIGKTSQTHSYICSTPPSK